MDFSVTEYQRRGAGCNLGSISTIAFTVSTVIRVRQCRQQETGRKLGDTVKSLLLMSRNQSAPCFDVHKDISAECHASWGLETVQPSSHHGEPGHKPCSILHCFHCESECLCAALPGKVAQGHEKSPARLLLCQMWGDPLPDHCPCAAPLCSGFGELRGWVQHCLQPQISLDPKKPFCGRSQLPGPAQVWQGCDGQLLCRATFLSLQPTPAFSITWHGQDPFQNSKPRNGLRFQTGKTQPRTETNESRRKLMALWWDKEWRRWKRSPWTGAVTMAYLSVGLVCKYLSYT